MVVTLGKDWATTREDIDNTLEDDFIKWDEVEKSGRKVDMFEKLRMVK